MFAQAVSVAIKQGDLAVIDGDSLGVEQRLHVVEVVRVQPFTAPAETTWAR